MSENDKCAAEKASTDAASQPKVMVALSSSATEVLRCLFIHGPTWDGNVPSKRGRDELVNMELAAQGNGWQWLTRLGIETCFANGIHQEKELHEAESRNRAHRSRYDAERRLEATINQLTEELASEQTRLAACGVAAMANTRESAAKQRIHVGNPNWSASYRDVCEAVEREMKLREERDATVLHFIGYLSGDIPELHRVEVRRLAESWEAFKARLADGAAMEACYRRIWAKGRITP